MPHPTYRQAEQRLWESVGRVPSERLVALPRLGTRVRVQQVGSGEQPVLFVHGGPNSGSTWAPLLEFLEADRFTCLVLDRPGTGLSEPVGSRASVTELAAHLVVDVLDALGVERGHVVASSLGGYCALRGAALHPGRYRRMVQLGCPALLPGQAPPPFMRALMKPGVRKIVAALPPSARASASIMRQIGHAASLDAGRLPPAHQDWYAALQRHTDTMRHDFDLIHSLRGPGGGFDPEVCLEESVLAGVDVPTHFLWGADDPFGDESTAQWLARVMPRATLEMLPDAGHLPWLDWPQRAAHACSTFLVAGREAPHR